MTGSELLEEIERQAYYKERERKNDEMAYYMKYAAIWLIIIGCLISIGQHLYELWRAFEI